MTQRQELIDAVFQLVESYKVVIQEYSIKDFLRAELDPFRFIFNCSICGVETAIQREIQHKIEMALENLFGKFHETYLGNVTYQPTGSKWHKIPNGTIPGIDIANTREKRYLQIKSKYNSMNSSSSKRLAYELSTLATNNKDWDVGCGWVIAGPNRKAIGEDLIREDAGVYKGKRLYAYVTGNVHEMDEVINDLPGIIKDVLDDYNPETALHEAASRVYKQLDELSNKDNCSIIEYIYNKATR